MGILEKVLRTRRRVRGVAFDIEGKQNVRKKFSELCRQRQNCEVFIGEMLFTSIFLSAEKDRFLTDILMPNRGNELLKEGEPVKITYQDRSVPYSMTCTFLGHSDEAGFAALMFSLPSVISYSNRRSYYRAAPTEVSPVRIIIDFGMGSGFDGRARDISGGGLSFKSPLSNVLSIGQKIGTVELLMPDGGWIICKGTVRRLSGSVVGIELEEIPRKDRRQIARYVAGRQKENIATKRG